MLFMVTSRQAFRSFSFFVFLSLMMSLDCLFQGVISSIDGLRDQESAANEVEKYKAELDFKKAAMAIKVNLTFLLSFDNLLKR